MKESKIRLAIILPADKARKIRIPERIESICKKKGIAVTTIDALNTVTIEGEFDVLLHKALDFYNVEGMSSESADEILKKVKVFIERNPKMVVIDDLESSRMMSNRKHCHNVMDTFSTDVGAISVFVPKSLEIPAGLSTACVRELIQESKIRFPILAKPMDTHNKQMSLIFSLDDLDDFETPSLVEEFYNHNGVMYKVFVMGDRYNVIQRPSIKDYSLSDYSVHKKPIKIDSRNVSKMGRGFHPEIHHSDPAKQKWLNSFDNPDLLDRDVLKLLCKRMSEASGLKMFGLDILVVKETGNYALVDINQFPGYKGVLDDVFADNFVEMIVNSCHGVSLK